MLLAVVDVNTPASSEPAWTGWTLLAGVLALGTRAWFIGLRVTDMTRVRHGWLRNRTIPKQRVVGVGSANYSGLWQIGPSNLFAMVVLQLADGSEVLVPELAGRPGASGTWSTRSNRPWDFQPHQCCAADGSNVRYSARPVGGIERACASVPPWSPGFRSRSLHLCATVSCSWCIAIHRVGGIPTVGTSSADMSRRASRLTGRHSGMPRRTRCPRPRPPTHPDDGQ